MAKCKYGVITDVGSRSSWYNFKRELIGEIFELPMHRKFTNKYGDYYGGNLNLLNKTKCVLFRKNQDICIYIENSTITINSFKYRKPTKKDWDRLLISEI